MLKTDTSNPKPLNWRYRYGRHVKTATKITILLLVLFLSGSLSLATERNARHRLQVEIFPQEQKLQAIDDLTIENNRSDRLDFKVARRAEKIAVTVNGNPRKYDFKNGQLTMRLSAREKNQKIQITIRYTAIFDDPVPVRPVNADNPGYGVSAAISERGSFLLAGSGWYPQWTGGHATYMLRVIAPEGWIAVTAGESKGYRTQNGHTTSTWLVENAVEGLSLSVGPYIVREKKVGSITAATYFFEETDHLAAEYLEATARYLALYQNLFGPYPFKKFAVVENFFPTGFGFPSYTLIGGRVLRLPFIIRTSLGHEIAHCWWGNGVLVDYDAGNWSEALTTYVADYLFREKKSDDEARQYRLQILRNYSTLVKPEKDFALKRFQSRYDPVTKTVGYDKGAMVFHMLRHKLGEETFWGTLRDLYRDRLFEVTSWTDIQFAFEARAHRPLKDFFDQWVFDKGAPRFHLTAVQSTQVGDAWKIKGRIVQEDPLFHFDLNLNLESRAQTISKTIRISEKETSFQIMSKSRPLRLVVDPDNHIMRRLFAVEIPPAINAIKGASSVVTVLSADLEPPVNSAARTLVVSLGLKNYTFAEENKIKREQLLGKDILMIGYPQNKALFRNLPDQIEINEKSFNLNSRTYDQSSDVFFGVFAHPYSENRIAALFLPLSSQQAESVARKVTHYGKYSYLAFRSGKNREKGFWPIEQSPLEYRWNNAKNNL
jgi:hypothetical protein